MELIKIASIIGGPGEYRNSRVVYAT